MFQLDVALWQCGNVAMWKQRICRKYFAASNNTKKRVVTALMVAAQSGKL